MRNLARVHCAMLASVVLAACSAVPQAPSQAPSQADSDRAAADEQAAQESADYSQLARGPGRVFRFDPAASRIRIYAFRGGPAGRAGHNHVVYPARFNAQAYLPDKGMNGAQLDLEFRLDELELDAPAERAALGPAFAGVIGADDIAGTRKHMLGEENLQAEKFPVVRVHALQIAGEPPKLAAQLQIELHGQRRASWVAVEATCLPERLCLAGSLVIKQTDFGIRPYSLLGGLVAVQDALVLEFQLVGG